MTTFGQFQTIVRNFGGVWRTPCVRFTRTQSEYNAAYRPNYPEPSLQDEDIHLIAPGGLWSHRKAADIQDNL